jgi:hypothetical protein
MPLAVAARPSAPVLPWFWLLECLLRVESGHCGGREGGYAVSVINLAKICVTALALAACGVQSGVVDRAVMSATLDCTSYDKQQRALQILRTRLATGKPLALRCDVANCSLGLAAGGALGGRSAVMIGPEGWLGIGWYNDQSSPSAQQKTWFKGAMESVSECRVDTRDGW